MVALNSQQRGDLNVSVSAVPLRGLSVSLFEFFAWLLVARPYRLTLLSMLGADQENSV